MKSDEAERSDSAQCVYCCEIRTKSTEWDSSQVCVWFDLHCHVLNMSTPSFLVSLSVRCRFLSFSLPMSFTVLTRSWALQVITFTYTAVTIEICTDWSWWMMASCIAHDVHFLIALNKATESKSKNVLCVIKPTYLHGIIFTCMQLCKVHIQCTMYDAYTHYQK